MTVPRESSDPPGRSIRQPRAGVHPGIAPGSILTPLADTAQTPPDVLARKIAGIE